MKINLKSTCKAFLILASATALFSFTNSTESNYREKMIPPGTIKIGANFFADQKELCNLDWKEYVFWTGRIFGKESEEYESVLPKTKVWNIPDLACLNEEFRNHYMNHSAYQRYPVIGISQEQAVKYLEWRSDRVFEMILINNKVIEQNFAQSAGDYFSIKNYFAGRYKNMEPDTVNFAYYPEYTLPSPEEFQELVDHNEFLVNEKKLKLSVKTDARYLKTQIGVRACNGRDYIQRPTRPVDIDWISDKEQLYNLDGNVSEWLNNGQVAGGSWRNNPADKHAIYRNNGASAFIGIRAVCKWKRYDPKANYDEEEEDDDY